MKLLLACIDEGNGRREMKASHWSSQDLEILPDDGKRYEIIDGELYESKQPHLDHLLVCTRVWELLQHWSRQTKSGLSIAAPGVLEYWIISWMEQQLELYRRDEAMLKLHSTLYRTDRLQSPHLPGFSCQVSDFFEDLF
jgi:Uma2 family endonuclease